MLYIVEFTMQNAKIDRSKLKSSHVADSFMFRAVSEEYLFYLGT